MAYRNYTDKDYQQALQGIMGSAYYRNNCCGVRCVIGGECRLCGRVNTSASEADIEETIYQAYTVGALHEQDKQNKKLVAARSAAKLANDLLITIVLDQRVCTQDNAEHVIQEQKKIIEAIICADYKWARDKEVLYNYEYFTTDEGKFKPHCHIALQKSCAPSTIQAQLYEKLVKGKKFPVYGVNVVVRPYGVALQYVKGDKQESKSEAIEKDNIFRTNHHLKKYYQF
jgi:hypothetical protein